MKLKWVNLTANATITLGTKHRTGDVVILVKGSFGGGTLTFGYKDQSGSFAPFASGTALTAAGEDSVSLAEGIVLMAELTGSTTPTIEVGTAADFYTQAP